MHTKDERESKWRATVEIAKKLDKARDCMHNAINKGITSELEQRGLEMCYLSNSFKQAAFELLNEYRVEELDRQADLARTVK